MPVRSRGSYELVFASSDQVLGFNLAHEDGRPAVVQLELGPARLDDVVRNADVPRTFDNLDRGMGYSRRIRGIDNGYDFCLPGYTRSPGAIFMPAGKLTPITLPAAVQPDNYITGMYRFNNTLFLTTYGRNVLALSPDGSAATVAATFASSMGPNESAAVFNNRLYATTVGGLYYSDAGGGWSGPWPPLRGAPAVVNWRPLGVPTDVLVATSTEFGSNAVRWCPIDRNPTVDADWSAPLRVGGDVQYGIHRLVAAPRHVFILRPDGIYDIDELGTRAFNIARWVAGAVDANNGIWGMHVGTGLYYSHAQGLAFVPTTGEAQYEPEWATPGWGLPYEGPVRGWGYYGCLHNGWGLYGQWDPAADQSFIVAGRRDPGAAYGAASHVWHGAEGVVAGRATLVRAVTVEWAYGTPRLLICTVGAGGVQAFWQSLPRFGSPLQDLVWGGGFVPADAASLYLPADPWDRPSAVKTLLELELVTERLNVGSDTLKVLASADGGPWADQGTAEDGPYDTLHPFETTEGRYISLRVDAAGSPILRSLDARVAMGIELREARVYRVILAYDNALATPVDREARDPERRMADLRALLGQIVELDDGTTRTPMKVRVLQVMGGERRRLAGPARQGAWAIVVPVMVSILDRPFRYDRSDHYDSDRVWR